MIEKPPRPEENSIAGLRLTSAQSSNQFPYYESLIHHILKFQKKRILWSADACHSMVSDFFGLHATDFQLLPE